LSLNAKESSLRRDMPESIRASNVSASVYIDLRWDSSSAYIVQVLLLAIVVFISIQLVLWLLAEIAQLVCSTIKEYLEMLILIVKGSCFAI
jgi:hypothetical protein